ncbi:16S rRNA (guanine(527)-N(7))-methyltransferase RsmG [Pacificimonas sp. WHA3]|uniref:Ribosomal RNA small subunit methyltransferase G n=1 Tax=Pacificimonas pallii TaxID=2827236 RepID=A0ABS6SCX9_9SPHN|nr:16S rRNA (guanine(527)-N(7))-methyltransferase RsmG [Pacificimonas pallii]MBV7255776.1 16S rRNA (guanine(527)-N(7))-methyltransferase RsmG [Pacificimonas pallii]
MPDVSRETEQKFTRYIEMLHEWQARMNLVAPSTLPHARQRHIEDSAQLIDLIPRNFQVRCWVDFGSGAGFPGIVAALMVSADVHLIESRTKKCTFLQAVVDELGLRDRVTVHNQRAETMTAPKADIISARACAALPTLFDWGHGFAAQHTLWLLPKGKGAAAEVDAARREFDFHAAFHPSRTDDEARILAVRDVRRKGKRR